MEIFAFYRMKGKGKQIVIRFDVFGMVKVFWGRVVVDHRVLVSFSLLRFAISYLRGFFYRSLSFLDLLHRFY